MVATSITFLTPLAALLALGALVPLAALFAIRRRANRVRGVVGVTRPPLRRLLVALTALAAAGVLLGAAAAQPVLQRTSTRVVRTDTEAFFVVDVSRSMLARSAPGASTRLARAKGAASDLRHELADVPVGLVSVTDRVLPHLFPTASIDVFDATIERSIGIERPPPRASISTNATNLNALTKLRLLRFFRPDTERRIVVVFTDGETQAVARSRLGALFRRTPSIDLLFVHLWAEDERVYTQGVPEPQYLPDPSSFAILEGIAESAGGDVFPERSVGVVGQRVRQLLGSGPTVDEGTEKGRDALAPYFALAAFVPLGLLLWRRDR